MAKMYWYVLGSMHNLRASQKPPTCTEHFVEMLSYEYDPKNVGHIFETHANMLSSSDVTKKTCGVLLLGCSVWF